MTETLDEALQTSMGLLAEGQADPGSAWRNTTLITLGADMCPQGRTVVLRRFDAGRRFVETHTDTRSAKFGELSVHPEASLHGWDAGRRVQLRLSGPATLHVSDKVADDAWAGLRPQTRATYRVVPGPGTVLAAPDRTAEVDEAAGRDVFCVVRLLFDRLEYLRLGSQGHRRARFTWSGGAFEATWVVP